MPLLKGLKIEQVVTRLKELQDLKLIERNKELGRAKHQRIVAEDEYCELIRSPLSAVSRSREDCTNWEALGILVIISHLIDTMYSASQGNWNVIVLTLNLTPGLPTDMEMQETWREGFPHEAYIFSRYLNIPRNLKACVQSVETSGFRIRHCLEFNLQLRNPDGK